MVKTDDAIQKPAWAAISLFLFFIFTIAILIFLPAGNSKSPATGPFPVGGKLDLGNSIPDDEIALNGEWIFCDRELLTSGKDTADSGEIVEVPHSWDETGFGTYVLTVSGLVPGTDYGLYVPDTTSAYMLFLDSAPAAGNGTVGRSRAEEVIDWHPVVIRFTPEKDEIGIAIQVSSFSTYPGGLIREIRLGPADAVVNAQHRRIAVQMVLLGGLLMIAMYNISLFILNPQDREYLYFTLFSLISGIRVTLTGEKLINILLPGLGWNLLMNVLFMSGALMLVFFVMFIAVVFRKEINRYVAGAVLGSSLILALLPLFVPMHLLNPADIAFLITAVSFFLYLLVVLIRAVIKHVQGSLFALMGIIFILAAIALDISLPPGNNMIPLGMFVFTIFQSLVVAEKHSHIQAKNRELHVVANRDGLTGLYKREYFLQEVENRLSESGDTFGHAMLFIDIDDFKSINDSFGHDTGDLVIRAVADIITRSLRFSDLACRYGGDEFILWLDSTNPEQAGMVAQRILERISRPLPAGPASITVGLSIGIGIYPDDCRTVDELCRVCDSRMYEAKKKGKNRFQGRT